MKKLSCRLLILLLFITNFSELFAIDAATKLGVVPRPQKMTLTGGKSYRLTSATKIYCNKKSLFSAKYLADFLKRSTGKSLKIIKSKSVNSGITLSVNSKLKGISNQGYTLSSSEKGIKILAKTEQGLFYGVQTFLQMLPPAVYSENPSKSIKIDWSIPAVKIKDEPYFKKIRGLHIDVSRHFIEKDDVFKIIDYLAMHKLNVLHMHLTDDPGWRIEIKAFPKLTEIGARGNHSGIGKGEPKFYTQEDLKEIIAYAKSRYIRVFPEVDIPGHMHAAIRSYPELKSPNDNRPKSKVIGNDSNVLNFCQQVLKEVHDIFGNVPIHVGFDEVNLGSKKPIYSDEEITDFGRKIISFIKKKLGTTPIVWDDAFEKGLHDKEVLVHWWRPGKNHWWRNLELTMDQKVQKYDQPYILSPACWTYFDMKNAPGSPGAAWAGVVSVNKIYKWEPLLDLVDADPSKRDLAQGVIACTWSESIRNMNAWQERVFPRIAALTEKTWAQPSDIDTTKPSWEIWRDNVLIKKQIPRYQQMGVNYWSKDNSDKLIQLK